MSNYFVFTDEAGVYHSRANAKHIRSHPFYIRSNVIMSIDDYRTYQNEMQRINGEYEIPFDQEIKWSDLWSKIKNKPRNTMISRMSESRLKGYYRKVFETATSKESLKFMFTITDIVSKTCDCASTYIYKWHLQDAFQRMQMDMGAGGFATFIMDELNEEQLSR